jgi:hypothetical protein
MKSVTFTDGIYDMYFNGDLQVTKDGRTYGFDYFESINSSDLLDIEIANLALNTLIFLQTISRRHMTNAMKSKLNNLEFHLKKITTS